MKKIIAAMVATVAMAVSAFAADLTVSGAVILPITTTTIDVDMGPFGTDSSSEDTTLLGIQVGADYFFNDLVGIGADMSYSTVISDGDGSNFNMFAGCALRVFNESNMNLVVTPGLNLDITMPDEGDSMTFFGLGADAKFGYKIMDNLSIDAGLSFVYNFYCSESEDGFEVSSYSFVPKIGCTYYF